MEIDVSLYENGEGGDLVLSGNDISTTSNIFNIIYMSLFGGNPGSETNVNTSDIQERNDWWGNIVLLQGQEESWFNSETEHVLNTVSLNSQGRIRIENAIKKDLSFLSTFATVSTSVYIESENKLSINIKVDQKGDNTNQYRFIWDSTKSEIIETKIL